jgi:hypothetical protein
MMTRAACDDVDVALGALMLMLQRPPLHTPHWMVG